MYSYQTMPQTNMISHPVNLNWNWTNRLCFSP